MNQLHEGPPKGFEKHWPWIRVIDLAKLRGQKPNTFRKWIQRIDRMAGGKVLTKFGARNSALYVNLRAYDALSPSVKQRDADLADLKVRVGELELKQRRCDVNWSKHASCDALKK